MVSSIRANESSRLVVAALQLCAPGLALFATSPALAQIGSSTSTEAEPASASSSSNAAGDASSDITVTARRFLADTSVSSSKLDQRIAEAPQSISVIDESLFHDIGARSYLEATNFVPGITFVGTYGNFPVVVARGYTIGGANSYKVNGAPLGVAKTFDNVAVQQVEFVKGGSGTTYGEGGPGGYINIVTRRPSRRTEFSSDLQAGSFGFLRGQAILSGPIDHNGDVRLLLGASYERGGSAARHEHPSNVAIYGAAEFDVTSELNLYVIGYYAHNVIKGLNNGWPNIVDRGADDEITGIRFPSNLDVRAATSEPWNRDKLDFKYVRAELTYKPSELVNFALLAGYTRISYRAFFDDVCCETRADYTSTLNSFSQSNVTSSLNGEARIFGTVKLADISTKYLITGEYREPRYSDAFSDYLEVDPNYSLINPRRDYPNPFTGRSNEDVFTSSARRNVRVKSASLTTITKIADKLSVTLAGRYDDFTSTRKDYDGYFAARTDAGSYPSHNTAYRASAIYEVIPGGRIYYSYGETFEINSGLLCSGGVLPPETGRIHEIGAKQELAGGKLLVSAAVYDIKTRGNAIQLPFGSCPGVSTDGLFKLGYGQRSRGTEVEIAGRILPGWNVSAGYAYTRARSNLELGSQPTSGMPPHQVTLFTIYDFQARALKGIGVGGGFTYLSSRFITEGDTPAQRLKAAGRFRADAAVYYRPSRTVSFSLNVKNIFDKKDPISPLSVNDYQNFWMEPRTFTVSTEITF